MPGHFVAVRIRCEKPGGTGRARSIELLADASDGTDSSHAVDRSGARYLFSTVELSRGELVDDAKREHLSGARPAHILELDLHLEWVGVNDGREDADDRHGIRSGAELRRYLDGLGYPCAFDGDADRCTCAALGDDRAQSEHTVGGLPVHAHNRVTLLQDAAGRRLGRKAPDGEDGREGVAEGGQCRCHGILLRVLHVDVGLGVRLLHRGAHRVDGIHRQHCFARVEIRLCHLEPARRLLATAGDVDGEHVEGAAGGVGLLPGNLDERHLLAAVDRRTEGVEDGPRLLDHIRCRHEREGEGAEHRGRQKHPPDTSEATSGRGE